MSPKTLASTLLRFSTSSSLMVPGALVAEIGSDALQDALSRGWLRPNEDTGFLMLTDQQTQLNEMRTLAESPEAEAPAPQVESNSRQFVMNHSARLKEAFGVGLSTGSSMPAPGSGQSRGAPVSGAPTTPTTPPIPFNKGDYTVGEDVVVAEEGKSYQAKVQAKNADGTYRLTFGPNRPSNQARMFRREEMQRIQPQRDGTIKIAQQQ